MATRRYLSRSQWRYGSSMGALFRHDFERLNGSPREHYILSPCVLAPNFLRRKLLIIDIEATGLDFTTEEITEIAAQEYDPVTEQAGDLWSRFVKVERPIPPEISRLTSITSEHTDSGISSRDALTYLVDRYSNYIWVAQCGFEFDFPFLERLYRESGLSGTGIDALDTKVLFSLLHPMRDETFSTNFLAEHFKIDRSRFARHTAAGDVALLTEITAGLVREAKRKGLCDVALFSPLRVWKFIPQSLM